MDTSEQYIKMRIAAIPDLGKGKPIEGGCNHIGNDIWVDEKGDWYYATEDKVCQLERQDQLQEMVIGSTLNSDKLGSLISRFWVFCSNFYNGIPTFQVFTSMEQLWLAFVMKNNHNKIWDGERWNN